MNENVIEQPVAAMYMVSKELNRLAGFTTEMLFSLKSTIMSNRPKKVNRSLQRSFNMKQFLLQDFSHTLNYIDCFFA